MVLVSLVLFMKTFYSEELEKFREKFKVDSSKEIDGDAYKKSVRSTLKGYSFILFFILLNVVPALIIALNCNRSTFMKILTVPFAVLFSDVYILWYVLMKFVIKSRGYCPSSLFGTSSRTHGNFSRVPHHPMSKH